MEVDIIQIATQAGGVGIAVYLIYTQRKEREKYINLLNDHVNKNTEVLQKLVNKIDQEGKTNEALLSFLKKNGNKN